MRAGAAKPPQSVSGRNPPLSRLRLLLLSLLSPFACSSALPSTGSIFIVHFNCRGLVGLFHANPVVAPTCATVVVFTCLRLCVCAYPRRGKPWRWMMDDAIASELLLLLLLLLNAIDSIVPF
jgi:hypothetical protein